MVLVVENTTLFLSWLTVDHALGDISYHAPYLDAGYINHIDMGRRTTPSDAHIRDLMDEVHPSYVFSVFDYIIESLKAKGFPDTFRSYNGNILCALDSVQYFSSQKIHCQSCNTKKHKNGTTTYYHTAITPVFVAPGHNQLISLPPEFITPQDGQTKQHFKIGVMLKQAREESGLTQEELASRLNTKESAISKIENYAGLEKICTCSWEKAKAGSRII